MTQSDVYTTIRGLYPQAGVVIAESLKWYQASNPMVECKAMIMPGPDGKLLEVKGASWDEVVNKVKNG